MGILVSFLFIAGMLAAFDAAVSAYEAYMLNRTFDSVDDYELMAKHSVPSDGVMWFMRLVKERQRVRKRAFVAVCISVALFASSAMVMWSA